MKTTRQMKRIDLPDALQVQDLTAHEELCRELEDHHDREEELGKREPFWPEDD